ncbi:MAG: EAL domain-containing protein [Actinobacteria bacterium]|nr:EAL domain-containing protein [Actinomycetota bacterium]
MNHASPDRARADDAPARVPTPEQLELYVQPVVRLGDRRIVGWEALVRGSNAVGVMRTPADFIPRAEQSGEIHEIGQWVLQESLGWLRGHAGPGRTVAVNVSALQFEHPEFVELVAQALSDADVAGERLILELTESVQLTDRAHARAVVDALRDIGVRVAIDDVGAGFADAELVRTLPAAVLKLDRSIVARMSMTGARAAVRRWVELANGCGMSVVAEGIQTAEDSAAAYELGCRFGQGTLYGPPVPAWSVEVPSPCGC